MTLADLEAVFRRWYQLKDTLTLRVTLAAVAANLADGDPFWLLLVAPPGSMKTEYVRALSAYPPIYPLSSLTPKTLASGFQSTDGETSLIKKLHGRILTLKDFTSVLTMQRDARQEILGQLREIYDGQFRKEYGNGKVVEWSGKVGLVAGVTPVIDAHVAVHQVLGERFVLWRLAADSAPAVSRRALEQCGQEALMRQEVREAVAAFLDELVPLNKAIPESITECLCALAPFVAAARTTVPMDRNGDVEDLPEPEGPARLTKQFAALARGLAIVHGTPTVTPDDYAIVFKLAEDSIPAARKRMLRYLVKGYTAEEPDTTQIATATGFPTTSARRHLLGLAAMQLVNRVAGGQGRADRWHLSSLAADYLDTADPTPLFLDPLSTSPHALHSPHKEKANGDS